MTYICFLCEEECEQAYLCLDFTSFVLKYIYFKFRYKYLHFKSLPTLFIIYFLQVGIYILQVYNHDMQLLLKADGLPLWQPYPIPSKSTPLNGEKYRLRSLTFSSFTRNCWLACATDDILWRFSGKPNILAFSTNRKFQKISSHVLSTPQQSFFNAHQARRLH